MVIGSIIKRLRQENDMTQEQLAEFLGITPRAVSQWECGRTAPDLSQLPALCHVFDVSSDVLLGIDLEKNDAIIQGVLDQAYNELSQGNLEISVDILREGVRRFPKSYRLMSRLADTLVGMYSRRNSQSYDDVFDLCDRILTTCTDNVIRYETMRTLATAYGYAGKQEELLKLAKQMPPIRLSYENFMTYHWEGDADFGELQKYLSFLIYHTVEVIGVAAVQRHDCQDYVYSLEERIQLWKTQIALLELLFPQGDYQVNAQLGEGACSWLCSTYMKQQNYEEVWHWLQKAADFAVHMDTYDADALHTSIVLRGYSGGGWIREAGGNRSQTILEWLMTDSKAEVLHADPRYAALVDHLRQAAQSV